MTRPASLSDPEEIDRFAHEMEQFLGGGSDAERFTAIRLQHGVYGQRQEGLYMLRIKIPGGRLDPDRLAAIADVLDDYAETDVAHITTRQDIQVHYVPLEHAPAAMRRLARAGLTTREACGNTIRNVTVCPLAGVCPKEHTDVSLHLDDAVRHFLRNPLNQQLPRKFKVSFSGCGADCAQSLIHDLGIVAVHDGGHGGFRVTAGGGLGHKPREAIVVEQFVREEDLIPVMEALVALHNRYSDRRLRAKSRLKFLVDRFGPQGFVEKYREELARTREALAGRRSARGEWRRGAHGGEAPGPGAPRGVFAQRQPQRYVLPIALRLGHLRAEPLRGLATLMREHGLTDVRTTQDQNLMVLDVPKERLPALRIGVTALGLTEPARGDNVVACPGSSTCRLGITSSMVVAPLLSGGEQDLRIRVSGCHNGCAQPETGDIGIYGEGKRLYGKLIPHYQVFAGGSGTAGGAIALRGPSVPAARVEEAIARVQRAYAQRRADAESFFHWARREGSAFFDELLADLAEVRPEDVARLARDHGDAAEFKVLQLGGGECAGATQLRVGAAFFEAAHERRHRGAFFHQRKMVEALACAEAMVRVIVQGLAQMLRRGPSGDLAETAALLGGLVPPAVSAPLAAFAETFTRSSEPDVAEIERLFAQVDAWALGAAQFCIARHPQLDLGEIVAAFHGRQPQAKPDEVGRQYDTLARTT
jgi:sulfite reductase (NADPH) hemoprotein beta-component